MTWTGKYKLRARAGNYKLGARAGRYKLEAKAGSRGPGPGPGVGKHKDPILINANKMVILRINE